MALTRQQKEQQVQDIKANIEKAHTVIVWEYLGLKAEEVSELRNKITKAGAKNTVYKNRVAKVAFQEAGKEEILDQLTGSSSFLFTYDDNMESISALNEVAKEKDFVNFKGAYIEGEFYNAEKITEIAGLPSKDDLLSMLLSVLQGNLRNLAYSLSQVAEQQPADESAATVEEAKEEPAEEPAVEETTQETAEEAAEEVEASEEVVEETTEEEKEEAAE